MATDKKDNTKPAADGSAAEGEPRRQPNLPQVELDERDVLAAYANFCRVTGTPEEVVLDFGLNSAPHTAQATQIKISQRVVMSFYTAKRMLAALQTAIVRHEAAFGVLETNVQKRISPNLRQAANQSSE